MFPNKIIFTVDNTKIGSKCYNINVNFICLVLNDWNKMAKGFLFKSFTHEVIYIIVINYIVRGVKSFASWVSGLAERWWFFF